MTLDVGELVAALPDDGRTESPSNAALQEMLSKLSHKPVPVGSLTRFWILGTMQAKIAAAYLAYWIRSSYATADEKQRQRNEAHLAAAVKLLGGMSYLRGAIMKVGQLLGAYPKVMPELFMETLSKLHFEAPPMHYALIREHMRNELGCDPEDVFDEFETRAFAAASLGQVHRARLRSGERVAVKVQYPNIAATIRSDFRNMKALLAPMRLTANWENLREQFDDMRQTLVRETDYESEAAFLRKARTCFEDGDQIVVPRVFDAYSTKRVLTMEYIDGVHLDDFLATHPPQSRRDHFGTLMMKATFRVCDRSRLWYSDPHPGNFLFCDDGRLGFIDFGCCREFNDDEWDYMRECTEAVYKGEDALEHAVVRAMDRQSVDQVDPGHMRCAIDVAHWVDDCLLHDGPFDFGSEEYIERGVALVTESVRKHYLRSMPLNNWLFRSFLGLRAILYRLRARVDMKHIGDTELRSVRE